MGTKTASSLGGGQERPPGADSAYSAGGDRIGSTGGGGSTVSSGSGGGAGGTAIGPSRNIGGTDWLKFIAALLVIANHTSPLASVSPQADFWIAGLISRVAVPIFFIGAGFFLFRKFSDDVSAGRSAVVRYTNKIALLYGLSILIYLPLNVYKGDFKGGFDLFAVLRDIVLDGTFYHLWFFPALWIGIWLIYALSRLPSLFWSWAAAAILYAIGLLGDSYYGFAAGSLHLKPAYDALYQWMDYTRNGLFFAPLPILAGAALARRTGGVGRAAFKAGGAADREPAVSAPVRASSTPPEPRRKRTPSGSARSANARIGAAALLALALLVAEGEWVRGLDLPRHDSMYLFSLPAAFLLFLWSTTWNVPGSKRLRAWRTWVYILHPLAIVLVRGAAKAVNGERLLIESSPVHYAAVCLLSVVLAAFAAAAMNRFGTWRRGARTKKRGENSSSSAPLRRFF
ncbi:acyltransferase family protein [Saccharibacillus alkalitolerans]|uniref:Acyltransferase family protein n=1 Tax=Saccharibacillus alkalitolerans TaxID=2705290 RepID=A0ABX0F8H6_9BACL|nr:acyltransferase family protein [Saccharibacillus alkalitolerans]NGZ77272.1 acyltransferase family protein [Saccharibacillus alkalitolerans]